MPVFADVVHHELNGLPVVQHQIELFHDLHGLLLQHPLEQRVDVLKVIVEGIAVDPTVLHNVLDSGAGNGDNYDIRNVNFKYVNVSFSNTKFILYNCNINWVNVM